MSDEPTIEARARDMGWRPQEEYKGDPTKYVEASEYVERGEQILPIVRDHNKRLEADVQSLKQQLQQSQALQQASADAIQALKESHEEDVERQTTRVRAQLMEELKAARSDGDVDAEMNLRDQIDQLKKPAAEQVATKVTAQAPQFTPEFLQWADRNKWYGTDIRRTALAEGVAKELRADTANASLVGIPFFDRVAAEVEKVFNSGRKITDKVEGGSGGGGSGGDGGSRKKGFADLPADAKEACDNQAKRLVGEGRAFKTTAEQRAHYAAQYFRGE